MRILYQKKLSPFCFKVRLTLDEKGLEYHTINKGMQEDLSDIKQMDPSGNLPILLDEENVLISQHQVICEYLEEMYNIGIMGDNPVSKAEIRRLCLWFDDKFYNDVTKHLLSEKITKMFDSSSPPNGRTISIARNNLEAHLRYFSHILNQFDFLAGDFLSLADFCGASHLAVLDYLGEVSWNKYKDVKDWYSKIKSRPSFQSILKERIENILPPSHYSNLDF